MLQSDSLAKVATLKQLPGMVFHAFELHVLKLVEQRGHLPVGSCSRLHQEKHGYDAARRESINRRLRQAFYQGAEEEASRGGRLLDEVELSRVIEQYPGDT